MENQMNNQQSFKMGQLKYGTILLFPSKSSGVYDMIQKYLGKTTQDLLIQLSGEKVIHQEILVTGTITLAQTDKCVHLIKRPLSDFKYLVLVRHKDMDKVSLEDYLNVLHKNWNVPYDYASLFLNILTHVVNNVPLLDQIIEKYVRTNIPYENKQMYICSEVVQRVLEDLNLPLFNNKSPEYISPTDILRSPNVNLLYRPVNFEM